MRVLMTALLFACSGDKAADSGVTDSEGDADSDTDADTDSDTDTSGFTLPTPNQASIYIAFYVGAEGVFEIDDTTAAAAAGSGEWGPFDYGAAFIWVVDPGTWQIVAYSGTNCVVSDQFMLNAGDEAEWNITALPGTFDPTTFVCSMP